VIKSGDAVINNDNLHTRFDFLHPAQAKIVKERMKIIISNSSDHGTISFASKMCLFLTNIRDPITVANKAFLLADQQSLFLVAHVSSSSVKNSLVLLAS